MLMKIILFILTILLSISQDAPIAISGIAFTMVHDDGYGLYLITPDGESHKKVIDCPTGCYNPNWSSDSRHMGFATDDGFAIIDILSGETQDIRSDFGVYAYQVPQTAAWRDDLSQVAYAARYDMENSLVIVDFEGITINRFDDVPVGAFRPIWDDERIIFESLGDLYQLDDGEITLLDISTDRYEDSPTIHNHQLVLRVQTDDAYAAVLFTQTGSHVLIEGIMDTFVWSPDGTQLAVNLWRDTTGAAIDIVIIDVKTGKITPVAENGMALYKPSWSPDGTQLAYIGTIADDSQGLFIVDSSGENAPIVLVSPLTNGNRPIPISSPAWGIYFNREGT